MNNEKPPLYDYRVICHCTSTNRKWIEKDWQQGLYNYEKDIFEVPSKLKKMFEHGRKKDLEIMESVGLVWL